MHVQQFASQGAQAYLSFCESVSSGIRGPHRHKWTVVVDPGVVPSPPVCHKHPAPEYWDMWYLQQIIESCTEVNFTEYSALLCTAPYSANSPNKQPAKPCCFVNVLLHEAQV